MGPAPLRDLVDHDEVRSGGRWRYLNRDTDGTEYGFNGVYHDIVTPERIVRTSEFEGMPGHVSLDTLTLEEVDGRTKYQSVEDRDAMAQSGMEEGASETMDRLAELLRTMR